MKRVAAARTVFDLAQLDLGKKIGEGGQGTVYAVQHTTVGADGGRAAVVYKQYRDEQLGDLDGEALHALVSRVNTLTDQDVRWLAAHAAWPSAVVTREGRPVGFLMRSVPSAYTFEFRGLSPRTPAKTKLTAFEYLLNDDSYTRRIGLTLTDQQRLALLASVAAVLAGLHRLGVAIGDLSPKNLLFARPPARDCYVIDCDAFRLRGASVLPQAETPDWALPAGEEKGTAAGDVYKFGLLVVRLLARNQAARDVAVLGSADKQLLKLVRRSLNPVAAQRPTAQQWEERLKALTKNVPEAKPAPAPTPAPAPAPPPRSTYRPPARPTPAPTRTPASRYVPYVPAARTTPPRSRYTPSGSRYMSRTTATHLLGSRPKTRWKAYWYDRDVARLTGPRRGRIRNALGLIGGLCVLIPTVFFFGVLRIASMPFRRERSGGCLGPAAAVFFAFVALVSVMAFVGWLGTRP